MAEGLSPQGVRSPSDGGERDRAGDVPTGARPRAKEQVRPTRDTKELALFGLKKFLRKRRGWGYSRFRDTYGSVRLYFNVLRCGSVRFFSGFVRPAVLCGAVRCGAVRCGAVNRTGSRRTDRKNPHREETGVFFF